jgi:thiol:disulfide interchange protein DsbD
MPYKIVLLTVVLLVLAIVTPVVYACPLSAPDGAFSISVQRDDEDVGLEFTWIIAPGYYLYRDEITVTLDGRSVKLATPRGEPRGFREVYRGLAMADTIGEQLPDTGVLVVTYKGCDQDAICFPPTRKTIDLATLPLSPSAADEHVDVSDPAVDRYQTSKE